MKLLSRQKIPEPSCVKKETVDIDILIASTNGARKIIEPIRMTNGSPVRVWI